ncbi:MAG: argininosuccinate lyase, partial [Natronomonas sp.]|nr:argininosuccinate lyase [Natronomonas sp.]
GGGTDVDAAYAALDAAAKDVLDAPLDARVDRDTVEVALDPVQSVASRDSVGGPAPATVERELTRVADGLDADRTMLRERREALGRAGSRLDEEVSRRA